MTQVLKDLTGVPSLRICVLAVLLAGCSTADVAREPHQDAPMASDPGWNQTIYNGYIDLSASATMPAPADAVSPWLMAIRAETGALRTEGLSGILMEIEYRSAYGGGGAAWLTEPGAMDDPADPIASVQVEEGDTAGVFITAEEIMSLDEPGFYVSGGGSGHYGLLGEIHLVLTGFYGQHPGDWSALGST